MRTLEGLRMVWVLVVDDDPMIGMLVATYLSSRDVRVVGTVEEGREQLRVASSAPSGVVTDHRLPDGSGLDFAQELRDGGVVPDDVPIVLISGLVQSMLATQAAEAGIALLDKRELGQLPELLGILPGDQPTDVP